jgi:triosephosphate isomerase
MRKPMALSNWKMTMTIAESLTFVREFRALAGDLVREVDVVVCPPFTALYPVAQALTGSPIMLGAQNVSTNDDPARTGQISTALLADVGCQWVTLGHWEVRRCFGDTDEIVNRKMHLALAAGLRPILLIGEAREARESFQSALDAQLGRVVGGCDAAQVATMAFVYEPEWTIGVAEPASPERVAAGCDFIREWMGERFGSPIAQAVRVIYGGSVTPVHAEALLVSPEVDGLGASRKGRQAETFVQIVRHISAAKAGR